MSTLNIPDHVHRIIKEHDELAERIAKLASFIDADNDIYRKLCDAEKKLLIRQLGVMVTYRDIIEQRLHLAGFRKTDPNPQRPLSELNIDLTEDENVNAIRLAELSIAEWRVVD